MELAPPATPAAPPVAEPEPGPELPPYRADEIPLGIWTWPDRRQVTATLHSISGMAAYRRSPSRSSAGSTTPRTTTLRPNHQLSRQRRPSTFYISDVHAITRSDRRSTTTPLVLSHPC